MQAMLKYDAASREVRLTVDRDYKAGKYLLHVHQAYIQALDTSHNAHAQQN